MIHTVFHIPTCPIIGQIHDKHGNGVHTIQNGNLSLSGSMVFEGLISSSNPINSSKINEHQ